MRFKKRFSRRCSRKMKDRLKKKGLKYILPIKSRKGDRVVCWCGKFNGIIISI